VFVEFRCLVAVEVEDRRLEQVGRDVEQVVLGLDAGALGVKDLPGKRLAFEQLAAGVLDQVAGVVVVVVPVVAGAVGQLTDQDRRAPLGQKQQGEAGRDDWPDVEPAAALPGAVVSALGLDEELAALAVPVVAAKEALAREPP